MIRLNPEEQSELDLITAHFADLVSSLTGDEDFISVDEEKGTKAASNDNLVQSTAAEIHAPAADSPLAPALAKTQAEAQASDNAKNQPTSPPSSSPGSVA